MMQQTTFASLAWAGKKEADQAREVFGGDAEGGAVGKDRSVDRAALSHTGKAVVD